MRRMKLLGIVVGFGFGLMDLSANAQTPSWKWARNATSGIAGYAEGYGIATDA